jgi:hypothetical protein
MLFAVVRRGVFESVRPNDVCRPGVARCRLLFNQKAQLVKSARAKVSCLLHFFVRVSDSRVIHQVAHSQAHSSTQRDEQVEGRRELGEFNTLDGRLLYVGDVGQLLLRESVLLAQES